MFTLRRHNFKPLRLSSTGVQSPRFFSSDTSVSRPFLSFAFSRWCSFTEKIGPQQLYCERTLFTSTSGYLFSSAEEIFVLLHSLPRVFLLSLVLPGASKRSLAARSLTHSRDNYFAQHFLSVVFPTRLGVPQLCCSSVFLSRD